MSVISEALIQERRRLLMTSTRCSVIVAIPTVTDSTTAGVFLLKDPDPADTADAGATTPSNAKGGSGTAGLSWKYYSYDDVGTAYSL